MIAKLKCNIKRSIKKHLTLTLALALTSSSASASDTINLVSPTLSNPDYHNGMLQSVKGVHNIQIYRANRELPDSADGKGWTYNHGPNIAFWNKTFYVQYLSNPVSEHVPPGLVYISSSQNGYNWSTPRVAFPPYKIPDGTTKKGYEGVAKDLFAVLHQRMGFYISKNNKLLTLGYYGLCLDNRDKPNDGKGIGRAVREIYENGTMGDIYFIRYNKAWNENKTSYPFYKTSKDKEFVKACDELLANPLMIQQWVEEADRDDPLIPLKKQYKAFSYYHLKDGKVVGLWKYALTSISIDNGKTWEYTPVRAPGFVNKNAKIWGQKAPDGSFVTIYNPSMFRWPLAISTSKDGIQYDNLYLINGEISTMRYGGQYKSYGPQYVRGILEGNGKPDDKNIWITYSMNKEDIWISKIPVPITIDENENINDIFNDLPDGSELDNWNIYSPLWAPVKIIRNNKEKWLSLSDWDNYDYAIAERIIPSSRKCSVEFTIYPQQNNTGMLHIEFQNRIGLPAIRIILNEKGEILFKDGYRLKKMMEYEAGTKYIISVEIDLDRSNYYEVYVNGKQEGRGICFAPVNAIEKIMFRTGERRYFPNIESPAMQEFDVDNGGIPCKKSEYLMRYLKTNIIE